MVLQLLGLIWVVLLTDIKVVVVLPAMVGGVLGGGTNVRESWQFDALRAQPVLMHIMPNIDSNQCQTCQYEIFAAKHPKG